ncbi:MAG: rhodanese-like domain-containing protein [Peptoniphilus sp.]|nr:rhodanese-like domain-containing protein [Peptoniphilus sp.]MDY3118709.1 rhodanese-like domain-containing protein [Peptoniphilus sp.]
MAFNGKSLMDRLFGTKIESIQARDLKDPSSKVILDVREPEEVAQGKIPGAYVIPLGGLPTRKMELPKDVPIYVICRSGNRSKRACRYLKDEGFLCVNVEGGMLAYEGEVV